MFPFSGARSRRAWNKAMGLVALVVVLGVSAAPATGQQTTRTFDAQGTVSQTSPGTVTPIIGLLDSPPPGVPSEATPLPIPDSPYGIYGLVTEQASFDGEFTGCSGNSGLCEPLEEAGIRITHNSTIFFIGFVEIGVVKFAGVIVDDVLVVDDLEDLEDGDLENSLRISSDGTTTGLISVGCLSGGSCRVSAADMGTWIVTESHGSLSPLKNASGEFSAVIDGHVGAEAGVFALGGAVNQAIWDGDEDEYDYEDEYEYDYEDEDEYD